MEFLGLEGIWSGGGREGAESQSGLVKCLNSRSQLVGVGVESVGVEGVGVEGVGVGVLQ